MVCVVVTGALVGGLIGFGLGFFSFKVKTRWCPLHGAVLKCPDCMKGLPVVIGDR